MYSEVPSPVNPSDADIVSALSTAVAEGYPLRAKSLRGYPIDNFTKFSDLSTDITVNNVTFSKWNTSVSSSIQIVYGENTVGILLENMDDRDRKLMNSPVSYIGINYWDLAGNYIGWEGFGAIEGVPIDIYRNLLQPDTDYRIEVILYHNKKRSFMSHSMYVHTPKLAVADFRPSVSFKTGTDINNVSTYPRISISSATSRGKKYGRIIIQEKDTGIVVYDKTNICYGRDITVPPGILKRATKYIVWPLLSFDGQIWMVGYVTEFATTSLQHKIYTTSVEPYTVRTPVSGRGVRAIAIDYYILIYPEHVQKPWDNSVTLNTTNSVYVYSSKTGSYVTTFNLPGTPSPSGVACFCKLNANNVLLNTGGWPSVTGSTGLFRITHVSGSTFTVVEVPDPDPFPNAMLFYAYDNLVYKIGQHEDGTTQQTYFTRTRVYSCKWDSATNNFLSIVDTTTREYENNLGLVENFTYTSLDSRSKLIIPYTTNKDKNQTARAYTSTVYGFKLGRLPDLDFPIYGCTLTTTKNNRIIGYGTPAMRDMWNTFNVTPSQLLNDNVTSFLFEIDIHSGEITILYETGVGGAAWPFICETEQGKLFFGGGLALGGHDHYGSNSYHRRADNFFLMEID